MKKSILFIMCLLLCVAMYAQQRTGFTLQGLVVDETDQPVAEATAHLKDKVGVGTLTDAEGKFSIKVTVGDVLVVSYVGYKQSEYVILKEEKEAITIKLAPETALDEVVVVGMGSKRKITSVGAVSTLDAKELQVPATSIANLLGGRMAGVISMQTSGEPGKNIAEFWIRGIGTFGYSSGALVLIDGLEGDLNAVDPADVESFSILKDASATSVYGVRGANGVVIITTKRGTSGKLSITGRANVSVSILKRLPEYLRAPEYATLVNEALEVRGEDPKYSAIEMDIIRNGLDPDIYPDVDWQKELIKRASLKQNYFVSARGGGDVARYYLSLAGSEEGAAYNVDKNSVYASNVGYGTYSYRSNLDITLTKTTNIYFGADGFLSIRRQPGIASTDYLWLAQSQINPLMFPVRYSTGDLPGAGGRTEMTSPYVLVNYYGRSITHDYEGKVTLAIDQDLSFITEGLNIYAQGAYNINSGFMESRTIMPALYRAEDKRNSYGALVLRETQAAQNVGYGKSTDQYRKLYFKSTLKWQRTVADDHRLSALINYEISDEKRASEGNSNLSAIPKRYQSAAGWLTYSFRDTYMMDVNFGYTGTENFQPGKQYGLFPSVGLGWIPTSYDWVKRAVPWFNFLKIKGTYGIVGNDRISGTRFPYLTRLSVGRNGIMGGGGVTTVHESFTGADNLEWERAIKMNLGLEGRLFNEKLTFAVDFFQDQRDGIFQQREQVPEYVGLVSRPFGNVGKMKSYGADGNAAFSHDINKDMRFTVRGNFTYSRNLIQNWEEIYQKYPYQERNGYPNSVLRGFQSLGLFKDADDVRYSPVQSWNTVMPGDIKYKDVNGDGRITDDDRVPLSFSTYPLLMYGIGGEFGYKNLTIGVLFKGTGQTPYYKVQNDGWGYIPFRNGEDGAVLKITADPHNRWIPREYAIAHGIDPALAENPDALFPRLMYGDNVNNRQMSDFWKGDARYLRLQEVTVQYNFKFAYLKKMGIKSLDLQFVGNNLYVWDKVKMFDPEQATANGRAYPIPMVLSLQLYINI